MEKHIKIICEQNPEMEIECPKCHKKYKIKTLDYMKIENKHVGTCKICGTKTTHDTTKLFKKLKLFKKFS